MDKVCLELERVPCVWGPSKNTNSDRGSSGKELGCGLFLLVRRLFFAALNETEGILTQPDDIGPANQTGKRGGVRRRGSVASRPRIYSNPTLSLSAHSLKTTKPSAHGTAFMWQTYCKPHVRGRRREQMIRESGELTNYLDPINNVTLLFRSDVSGRRGGPVSASLFATRDVQWGYSNAVGDHRQFILVLCLRDRRK